MSCVLLKAVVAASLTVSVAPRSPSMAEEPISLALSIAEEAALLACLEKSRAKRPQTARDLALLIARCKEAQAWSIEDADAWWGRHERGQAGAASHAGLSRSGSASADAAASRTANRGHDVTIDQPR